MRKIEKTSEPIELAEFKKKKPKKIYDDLNPELRMMIRQKLVVEQRYICAYCCRRIDSNNATNEHIKPRSSYPQCSLDYDNLVASCQEKQTCDKHKEDKYDSDLFVSPLESNCQSHFRFHPNGEIEGLSERGKYTIDLLNLNAYSLVTARHNLMKELDFADISYIEYLLNEDESRLPIFTDMIEYFMSIGFFINSAT